MNEISEKLTNDEMVDVEEIAELVKKLPPEEKTRVLYRLQGAVMILEAMNAPRTAAAQ